MNLFRRLYLRWRFRHDPATDLLADYEVLIRLARRCAYDLAHTVDEMPRSNVMIAEMGMDERAAYWKCLFSKGNPGKDYRIKAAVQIEDADRAVTECIKLIEAAGLQAPKSATVYEERYRLPF